MLVFILGFAAGVAVVLAWGSLTVWREVIQMDKQRKAEAERDAKDVRDWFRSEFAPTLAKSKIDESVKGTGTNSFVKPKE